VEENTIEVVVDFESLGLGPDAVLLAVAGVAVERVSGQIVSDFSAGIDPRNQPGRTIDAGTVLWWMAQGDAARKRITDAVKMLDDGPAPDATEEEIDAHHESQAIPLMHAAMAYVGWIEYLQENFGTVTKFWSQGAVDAGWVQSMLDQAGLKNPLKYWDHMDLRTALAVHPDVARVKPTVAHDALADATAQAQTLIALHAKLDGRSITTTEDSSNAQIH